MDKEQPRLNQIIFIDLGYSDEWDNLEKTRPYVIKKVGEEDNYFLLQLLIITSQDESKIKDEERQFISQYEIRQLPDCLKIDPSFVRIHRYVNLKIIKDKLGEILCNKCPQECFKWLEEKKQNEFDFVVKKHEDYRSNKLNVSKLRPPIEVEIN